MGWPGLEEEEWSQQPGRNEQNYCSCRLGVSSLQRCLGWCSSPQKGSNAWFVQFSLYWVPWLVGGAFASVASEKQGISCWRHEVVQDLLQKWQWYRIFQSIISDAWPSGTLFGRPSTKNLSRLNTVNPPKEYYQWVGVARILDQTVHMPHLSQKSWNTTAQHSLPDVLNLNAL